MYHWIADIDEVSHDLAAVVDPVDVRRPGPGDINGGEAAVRIQEAMGPSCVIEMYHELAGVIDPAGNGARSPGESDGGEAAACIHEGT